MATRLRQTFHYPSSDSDSSTPEDEEEQEQTITNLRTRAEQQTTFYRHAFLLLPLTSILIYIPSLLVPRSRRHFLTALLSITSLACTAYILYFIPPKGSASSAAGFRNRNGRSNGTLSMSSKARGKRAAYLSNGQERSGLMETVSRCVQSLETDPNGPVQMYLPALSGILTTALALVSVLTLWKSDLEAAWRGALPCLIWGVVMVARAILGDGEEGAVEGLEGLRFELKGA